MRLVPRLALGATVAAVLLALLAPAAPATRLDPLVATVGGVVAGIALYLAVSRRRPYIPPLAPAAVAACIVLVVAAAAAFIVHAYFVLGIAVHENHLYFALPLLALAAAVRPQLRPIHMAISAVVTLNLLLFFGLGRGIPLPQRNFTIIDATAILAAANCALFVWHLRVFRRESIDVSY